MAVIAGLDNEPNVQTRKAWPNRSRHIRGTSHAAQPGQAGDRWLSVAIQGRTRPPISISRWTTRRRYEEGRSLQQQLGVDYLWCSGRRRRRLTAARSTRERHRPVVRIGQGGRNRRSTPRQAVRPAAQPGARAGTRRTPSRKRRTTWRRRSARRRDGEVETVSK